MWLNRKKRRIYVCMCVKNIDALRQNDDCECRKKNICTVMICDDV